MRGKNKLDVHFSGLTDALSVGEYLHPVVHGVNAGGDKPSRALDLDEAKAAGADLINIFEIAKRGYLDARIFRRFKNGDASGNGVLDVIDFYIDHIHICYPSYFLMIAPNLQVS